MKTEEHKAIENEATKRIVADLKSLRERSGLSIQDISTRVGMDRSQYAKLEAGQNSPSVGNLNRILNEFNCELAVIDKASGRPLNAPHEKVSLGDVLRFIADMDAKIRENTQSNNQ